jgi:dephospho-CoA kinase
MDLDKQLKKVYISKDRIIFVLGLSGSGKTTIVKKISEYKPDYKVISIDSIINPIVKKLNPNTKKMKMSEKHKIWNKYAHSVVVDILKNLNIDEKYIIEGITLFHPDNIKLLEDHLNVFIDAPYKTIIERRTKREIERKEKKLGRKLSSEEIESKYNNSRIVYRNYIPLVENYLEYIHPLVIKNY